MPDEATSENYTTKLSQQGQSERTRGHIWKVHKERNNINVRNESFPHRCVQMWNCLPEQVVSAASVLSFKNRLDKHWSREPIVYDYKAPPPTRRRNYMDLTIEA